MESTFLDNFPFKEVRAKQKDVLEKIQNDWDSYKFFICELPTGFGKSPVSNAIGMTVDNAFLLTMTKQLQDQYVRDFSEPRNVALKGKANYRCNINPALNVECGPCVVDNALLKDCKNKGICSYYSQREKAVRSNIAVLSVPFFLFSTTCGGYWKPRDVVIIDECHLLESQLVNWATTEIYPSEIEKDYGFKVTQFKGTEPGYEQNKRWLNKIWKELLAKREELMDEVKLMLNGQEPGDMDEDELQELLRSHNAYYKIDKLYKKLEVFFNSTTKDKWLVEPQDDGLILTPVEVHDLFHRYVKRMAKKKIIFMSATILDMAGFCKTFHLRKSEAALTRVEPDFPPARSPIIYKPSGPMNFKSLDSTIPKIVEHVKEIMAKHPDQKGIIHSGNYRVAQAIYDAIDDPRLIMRGEGENNEFIIKKHEMSSEPTILLSPSLTTGADLKDDLSRWQIIVKLPWSSLADKRVAKKTELDGDWYVAEMFRTVIQAAGRSTRSSSDWSITYVLDSSFYSWIVKCQTWFPKQLLRRIVWKSDSFDIEEFNRRVGN
jgi:ATP-dependent DNA helicase DinG